MFTQDSGATEKRRAPWWVYVIVVIGLNLLKQQFMDGVPIAVNVAVTIVVVAVALGGVTWAWRRFATPEGR